VLILTYKKVHTFNQFNTLPEELVKNIYIANLSFLIAILLGEALNFKYPPTFV
jgi:hypothetical protein